mgnify:CR=1 FL=1
MGIREELSDRYDDDLLFADGYDGAMIVLLLAFVAAAIQEGWLTMLKRWSKSA